MKISRRQLERIINEALEDESGGSAITPPTNPYGLPPRDPNSPAAMRNADIAARKAERFGQPEKWSARYREPIYDSHIGEVAMAAEAVKTAVENLHAKLKANISIDHSSGLDSDFAMKTNDWETKARIGVTRAMTNLIRENPAYLAYVRDLLDMSERLSRHETKRRSSGGVSGV